MNKNFEISENYSASEYIKDMITTKMYELSTEEEGFFSALEDNDNVRNSTFEELYRGFVRNGGFKNSSCEKDLDSLFDLYIEKNLKRIAAKNIIKEIKQIYL